MDVINSVATCLMAVGAFLILWQIGETRRQAQTAFEDSLDGAYREIISRLPTSALLNKQLKRKEIDQLLDEFYGYFDLCNQQVFLRQRKRISGDTWKYWADGIRSNLARPAFADAWSIIKSSDTVVFSELRRLETSGFMQDPVEWPSTQQP